MPERVGPDCCRWCAKPIVQGKRARSWHPECVDEFMAHSRLDAQRRIVVKRDGERCWECGAAPMKWLRERQETFGIYSAEYARKHPELWTPIRKRWGRAPARGVGAAHSTASSWATSAANSGSSASSRLALATP